MKSIFLYSAAILMIQANIDASAGCLQMNGIHSGGISTESSSFTNNCPVTVGYSYCIESSEGGPLNCNQQKFGSGTVPPGQREIISVMHNGNSNFRLKWIECQSKNGVKFPIPVNPTFDGLNIQAQCK